MKKLAITIAIIFGLGMGVYAQGGLFGYGAVSDEQYYGSGAPSTFDQNYFGLSLFRVNHDINDLNIPDHGLNTDQNGVAPLGGGVLLLIGFGAAYALKKKREE